MDSIDIEPPSQLPDCAVKVRQCLHAKARTGDLLQSVLNGFFLLE